jgi:hypothetical protein
MTGAVPGAVDPEKRASAGAGAKRASGGERLGGEETAAARLARLREELDWDGPYLSMEEAISLIPRYPHEALLRLQCEMLARRAHRAWRAGAKARKPRAPGPLLAGILAGRKRAALHRR